MPIRAINSVSPGFCGNKVKKKLKAKTVLKTAALLGAAGAAVTYATQKGKGGVVDLIIAELQPLKNSALKFASNILNKISP